jgi:hypothetical protein
MITAPPPNRRGLEFSRLNVGDTFFFVEEQSGAELACIKIRAVEVANSFVLDTKSFNAVELTTGYLQAIPQDCPVQIFHASLTYL